uniref:Nipped-B protein n=1 Tax=Schistocephalus solidus TaxID=70667 RepID=A0A0X3NT48_SCHSO
MNGDISRIPIQSLGAVFSLTDILPELPLPSALPHGPGNDTFLSDSVLSNDAVRCLLSKDETLTSILAEALTNVSTDNIDLNDNPSTEALDSSNLPPLLVSVLQKNDSVFHRKRGSYLESQKKHGVPNCKWNSQSKNDPNGSLDEISESPSKKKHKKKKHKRRKSDHNDNNASSGVDSAAATPAGSSCGARSTSEDVISSATPQVPYGVSVNVNPDEKKILLKFSFKRPPTDDSTCNHVQSTESKAKKEKKTKRSKDHDCKRHRSLESKQPKVSAGYLFESKPNQGLPFSKPTCDPIDPFEMSPQLVLSANGTAPMPTKLISNVPSNFTSSEQLDHKTSLPPPSTLSPNSMLEGIAAISSSSSHPADLRMVFDTSIINSSSSRMDYASPDLFLNDLAVSHAFNSSTSHPVAPAPPNFSVMDYDNYIPTDLLGMTANLAPSVSSGPLFSGETGQASNCSPSQESKVYRGSFMVASHLDYDLKRPTQDQALFLDNIPTSTSVPEFHNSALHMSTPQKVSSSHLKGYDIASLADPMSQVTPMGLASYLNSSQQNPKSTPSMQSPNNAHLHSTSKAVNASGKPPRRRPIVSRRRRRNELEDLRSWAVKYPSGTPTSASLKPNAVDRLSDETSSWDATVGSYSQALGERAKRRKRMANHPSALTSDFVYENDKDYPKPLPPRGEDMEGDSTEKPATDISIGGEDAEAGGGGRTSDDESSAHISTRYSRTGVNKRSYAGMDDNEDVPDDECYKDPETGSRRRRKANDDDEPFEVRLKEPAEQRFPHLQKAAEQVRPTRERVRFKAFGTQLSESSASANSLKKFLSRVDKILEAVEELDLLTPMVKGSSLKKMDGDVINVDEDEAEAEEAAVALADASVPAEATIAPSDLAELSKDVAKLKSTGSANQVPMDRLLKLLTLLLLNVRDGANVTPTSSQDASDRRESRLWREIAMERVTRSVQSSLISITLMTSKDMPREIYLEDVIEQVVQVTRFQLSNCIYPEYDPAYRVENTAKDNQNSIKSRRARERDIHKSTAIVHLYYRLVEIVSSLAELVNMQRLTDSLVLALSSLGVSAFFVENVTELQLAALKLVTGIFSQYEAHRNLIVEDIIASIARLPSSKKNLRAYRLNSEESIQMFTALALLLVQSVIELPTRPTDQKASSANADEISAAAAANNPDPSKAKPSRPDDEVLVTSSYQTALRTAHSFLAVFLKKSTTRGEDDYRIIFENFVNDLLLTVNKPEWPAAEVMLSLLGSLLVQQFNNKSLDQAIRVTSVDYLGTVASTLRHDAVTSQLKEHDIDLIIKELIDGNQSDSEEEEASEAETTEAKSDLEERKKKARRKEEEEQEQDENKDEIKENGLAPETKDSKSEPVDEEATKKTDDGEKGDIQVPSAEAVISIDGVQKETAANGRRHKRKSTLANSTNTPATDPAPSAPAEMDRILVLRDAMLDYLLEDAANPVALYACKFYMAQWLEDCSKEVERAQRLANASESETGETAEAQTSSAVPQPSGRRSSRRVVPPTTSTSLSATDLAEQRRQYLMDRLRDDPANWRLRCRAKGNRLGSSVMVNAGGTNPFSRQSEKLRVLFKGTIDYEDAYLICRYLASLRPFSQSFDVYLSQICKLLSESSVAVRTKALRCLSAVVEADPGVLARCDIELAVRSRLHDSSTSVREAAVDLLGRFLVCRPELTAQYYPMLSDRIRDTGVSVRKRVIRILRDICIEQPDFARIADICVMIIRRVKDEESVKKLVNEVFQTLWFTPVREKESVKLLRKVMNITDVVAASKETGYEWFEQFLESLLSKEEGEKVRPVEKACVQIVECLVQNIMRLEEIPGQTNRLVACLATLHLFTKIRPQLMVKHAMLIQPYLSIRGHGTSDAHILHYVARILEVTVPLLEHPSETFLAQLEEDMVRLTLRQGKIVLESCVACLGAVVNQVSKNYSLTRDCFSRFFNALVRFKDDLTAEPEKPISPQIRPSILRALFTVGLLCKHFDPNVFQRGTQPKILDQVFDTLMFFSEQLKTDLEMRKKALAGLGFLCTRHHELLCGSRLCNFYHHLLQAPHPPQSTGSAANTSSRPQSDGSVELKNLVLENLLHFFLEEERRMLEADAKWKACHKEESLKIMGDVASGIGSHVAQAYLKDILESFFSPSPSVRLTSLSVITTILRQGLIHPVQTVPYLIATQTDYDPNVRFKAETQLQEIDNKFPGFISMRATQGVCMSFRLQAVLHASGCLHKTDARPDEPAAAAASVPEGTSATCTPQQTPQKTASASSTRRSTRHHNQQSQQSESENLSQETVSAPTAVVPDSGGRTPAALPVVIDYGAIRGSRNVDSDIPSALNSQLYSMLRGNRGQRRSFLNGLLALFDDSQRLSLARLVYVADNLAFFPYQCQEEPLFVIHHIDLTVSMNGSTLLQSVREALFPEFKAALEAAMAAQRAAEAESTAAAVPGISDDHPAIQQQNQQTTASEGRQTRAESAAATPSKQSLFKLTASASSSSVLNVGREATSSFNSSITSLYVDEENEDAMVTRLVSSGPAGFAAVRNAVHASRACLLLLNLKQYLKDVYGMTDSKVQKYSPTDSSKLWEKQLTRRSGVRFVPTLCLRSAAEEIAEVASNAIAPRAVASSDEKAVAEANSGSAAAEEQQSFANTASNAQPEDTQEISTEAARALVFEFLEFRKLILSIDPPDEDDTLDTSMNAGEVGQSLQAGDTATDTVPTRLPPGRTLVPQTHGRSSDEEDENSDDSNAGGASRLLLAQSAPQRRRGASGSAIATRSARVTRPTPTKRRSTRQKRMRVVLSSDEDSESPFESEASDADSS